MVQEQNRPRQSTRIRGARVAVIALGGVLISIYLFGVFSTFGFEWTGFGGKRSGTGCSYWEQWPSRSY
jgi:hypothetical protein